MWGSSEICKPASGSSKPKIDSKCFSPRLPCWGTVGRVVWLFGVNDLSYPVSCPVWQHTTDAGQCLPSIVLALGTLSLGDVMASSALIFPAPLLSISQTQSLLDHEPKSIIGTNGHTA